MPKEELSQQIRHYALDLHPNDDGLSAERILAATQNMLVNGRNHLANKPLNIFRNLKMRRKLSYWKY